MEDSDADSPSSVERRQLRAGRQHADDGVLRPAEDQAAAEHLRVASEPILPEALTDYRHRWVVGPFVGARQRSAQRNRRLKNVEDRARRAYDGYLRRIAGAREVGPAPLDHGDRGERRGPSSPLLEVPRVDGERRVLPGDGWLHLANGHEMLRLAVRERSQHHAVQDGEHGRRGA